MASSQSLHPFALYPSPQRFMIHLQGGGWCINPDDCASRANTSLGSSNTFASEKDDVRFGIGFGFGVLAPYYES